MEIVDEIIANKAQQDVEAKTQQSYIKACEMLFEEHDPNEYQRAYFKHMSGIEVTNEEEEMLADLNFFFSLCS